MNDKVTAMNTAPASTPSKDIPAAAPSVQPEKTEESKPNIVEPAVAAPAVKV
jgi:hypothetical protein